MDLWIPCHDQHFDYFSNYFWLYHPGDPDHSDFFYTNFCIQFVFDSKNAHPQTQLMLNEHFSMKF